MNISELIKIIKDDFIAKEIDLLYTTTIPHIGIIVNGQIVDFEHDYSQLQIILEIYTGETDECDTWEGKKYLFIFSEDGENVSDFKLMGKSKKLGEILFEK